MDKLWAPWRSKYIYMRKHKKCIFCGNDRRSGSEKHILARTKHSFSMLNLYPYNNGHVMVAPFRHAASLESLTKEELSDLMALAVKTKLKIDKKLKPDGYNIGINIGKVSGAGFAGHLHVHIVPRWKGDTNFMPLISGTKVVSESLEAMNKLLRD